MPASYPILLLDDDVHLADMLRRAATSSFPQAQFVAIRSYTEAVAYLDDLRGVGPRLVLLALSFQGPRRGLDFLARLRQHPQGRLLPVVMLSVDAQQEVVTHAYQAGASALTLKPHTEEGWREYLHQLCSYWFSTVTLPQVDFGNSFDPLNQ